MMKFYIFTVILFFLLRNSFGKNIEGYRITEQQQKIIKSIIDHLHVKNFIMLKNVPSDFDFQSVQLTKDFSQEGIYSNFLTVHQLTESMNQLYYRVTTDDIVKLNVKPYEYFKRLRVGVHPPKTMALFRHNKVFREQIGTIFTENNEAFLSKYIWLSFLDDELVTDIFNNSYIPYDCEYFIVKNSSSVKLEYDITEIYHPLRRVRVLNELHFGEWNEEEGLEVFGFDFYQRRLNMKGSVMVVGTDELEGYYPEGYSDYREFLFEMGKLMNISYETLHIDSRLVPNSYNKPYGNELIDVFMIGLAINHFSSLYDWVGPFRKLPAVLFFAYDKSYTEGGISPYLRPFSTKLMVVILIWLSVTGICIVLIEYATSVLKPESNFNLIHVFHCILSPTIIFLNQSGDEGSKSIKIRTILSTAQMVTLFLIPAYSGMILSFIVTPKLTLPFTDMKEFAEDGSYRLGHIIIYDVIMDMENPVVKYVSENLLIEEEQTPVNSTDAVDKMCKDHKLVILTADEWKYRKNMIPICQIIQTTKPEYITWKVLLLRHGSPFKAIFNRLLKTVYSSGLIKYWNKVSTGSIYSSLEPNIRSDIEVNLENVQDLFKAIAILYSSSVAILFLELIFHKGKLKK